MTERKWKLISTEEAAKHWNNWLTAIGNQCLYQTFEWGSHKERIGQKQFRFAYAEEGQPPILMLQGHLKRMPLGLCVLWIPGGPIGALDELRQDSLLVLKNLLGAKHLLMRTSLMQDRTAEAVCILKKQGLREATCKINSGLSMALSLPAFGTDALAGGSSNWRHNLRRGQKRATGQRMDVLDAKEIAHTYRTLQETKGLSEQFSESAIAAMIETFGSKLIAFGSRTPEGKLIAMRACICVGETGWDIWAAATEEARKNYTSHVLLGQLLEACQERGLKYYDLSGIDPAKVSGVYNFKRGTGARHVEYLGEWDIGPQWISRLLDFYLTLRSSF